MSAIKHLLDEICYLHNRGYSEDQIAVALGITVNNVKDALDNYYDQMYGEA